MKRCREILYSLSCDAMLEHVIQYVGPNQNVTFQLQYYYQYIYYINNRRQKSEKLNTKLSN